MKNQKVDNSHHDYNAQSKKAQSYSSSPLSSKANTTNANNKLPTTTNTAATTALSVL